MFGLVSGNVHQVEHCRNQFSILRPQIERIEVEAQTREQRQTKNRGGQRRPDYPVAPLLQKAVQRSQRGITDRIGLTGWLEHREQGRKQG